MNNSIVPVNLVIKSLRDNGYKNTAYAIAELIDNSIQHGSTKVNLICLEKEQFLNTSSVFRVNEIAVLDNGKGMSKDILQMALQFGNGTNLTKENQKGIGKFGMGLPSSSISQGQRVDVWTWQNGKESSLYSYLDVKEIMSGELTSVPEPVRKEMPKKWLEINGELGKSGTLVVWSRLDKCLWKTGKTIIDHSEFVVGRMYRKFLNDKKCTITAVSVREGNLNKPELKKIFVANDPLYLMTKTSVSDKLSEQGLPDPMFVKYGGEEGYEKIYPIEYDGEKHEVKVRYSIASEQARKGGGSNPHGKHARNNIGISVVRADRELYLDASWVIGYDPRERWWGIEVEFPPALDEVFGVTNNKQYANNFRELGNLDIENIINESNQTTYEFKEELKADNDPKVYLIELAIDIKNQLKTIRALIKAQAKTLEKDEGDTRHGKKDDEAEKHATEVTKNRKEEGHLGESDKKAEGKTDEEKLKEIENELMEDEAPYAKEFAEDIFNSNVLYQFLTANLDSKAFFSCKPVGGKIIIKLNTNHPAYEHFVEVLTDDISPESSSDDLQQRLYMAKNGLKLLLMAWARYEDEQPDGKLKSKAQDARMDWGAMASEFLREE